MKSFLNSFKKHQNSYFESKKPKALRKRVPEGYIIYEGIKLIIEGLEFRVIGYTESESRYRFGRIWAKIGNDVYVYEPALNESGHPVAPSDIIAVWVNSEWEKGGIGQALQVLKTKGNHIQGGKKAVADPPPVNHPKYSAFNKSKVAVDRPYSQVASYQQRKGSRRNLKEGSSGEWVVENSSWFDSHPYDVEKIKLAVSSSGGTNTRLENAYGWSNQPEVVVFTAPESQISTIKQAVQEALGTEWIIISDKVQVWKTMNESRASSKSFIVESGYIVGDDGREFVLTVNDRIEK